MPPTKRTKRSTGDDLVLPPPILDGPSFPTGENDQSLHHALEERVKELNCLYAITELAEPTPKSLRGFLEGLVLVLERSWQYPEATCVRVRVEDVEVASEAFAETPWRQASDIRIRGEESGVVEVFYREERPPLFEGPFALEERALLNAVAARVGHTAERIRAQNELREANQRLRREQRALQEANSALRVMLSQLEEEKRSIRADIQANVNKILLPLLDELALDPQPRTVQTIHLLRDRLQDIASPFIHELSAKFASLTPTEIQICNLIRGGLRTKEIAGLRNVAPSTIHRHRERIRHKLGIANEDVNLATYLQRIEPGGSG